MHYSLRALLILLAIGPPVLAGAWYGWSAWSEYRDRQLHHLEWGGAITLDFSFPPNSPGYRWKQSRKDRNWFEVPIKTPPYGNAPEFAPAP
jgi:hypothetical protein